MTKKQTEKVIKVFEEMYKYYKGSVILSEAVKYTPP